MRDHACPWRQQAAHTARCCGMEKSVGVSLPPDKMSPDGKLRALEMIRDDLRRNEASPPSPARHRDVLGCREARLRAGSEKSIPREDAKRSIRESAG
jgi:hypothetical protein